MNFPDHDCINPPTMTANTRLFPEFPPITKQQWLTEIEKDLKGKPYDTLRHTTPEGISLEPFYHNDDRPTKRPAFSAGQTNNDWAIGEDIIVSNAKKANQQLLAALNGGVNAPRLVFTKSPTLVSLQLILQDVNLAYISLHLAGKIAPEKVLLNLHLIAQQNNVSPNDIQGSLQFDVNSLKINELIDLIEFTENTLSHFKVLTFHGNDLATLTKNGVSLIHQLRERNVPIEKLQARVQFSLEIGKSYFYEIARLRALKLVWANILAAYGCTNTTMPTIQAHFRLDTQTDDTNTNMIRATTQALSAAIGGVTSLTVLPSDGGKGENPDFSRRIARNVQHLLKMESYLDKVIDPAAGSYYIEHLTDALAEKVWELVIGELVIG
jgi:methylmalonyl-CoA mutase